MREARWLQLVSPAAEGTEKLDNELKATALCFLLSVVGTADDFLPERKQNTEGMMSLRKQER